jgi:anti-sigma factor RsiW
MIIRLIHPYLDGELDVKESIRVQAHLEECERCRLLYQDEKAFLDLLPSGLATRSAPRLARRHISDALSRR